jgi:hypothetical protein
MSRLETGAVQVSQQWAPFSQGHFVVRHTFLDFAASAEDEISRIKRASSDGALCEQGKDMCASSEDGGEVGEGDGDDITLCGLSECDTHEAERLSELEDHSADPSSEDSASSIGQSASSVGQQSVCDYQKQLEDLAKENARLAQENSTLKTQVPSSDEESAATPQVSLQPQMQYFPGPCQGVMAYPAMWQPQFGVPQPQGMGGWWIPTMVPPNQITAVGPNEVQPPVEDESTKGAQGARRSRRSRASRDLAPGKPVVQEGSLRRTNALDRILPDPVAPMPELADGKKRTTVMLRNMPNNYSRTMLLELLDAEGFAGQYDFLYLPMDFQSRASLGYAFINFTSSESAEAFWRVFDGYSNWAIPSRKMSGVSWSGPHQGLEAHIERYRNSPVMAESTPDEYKPILFDRGVRIPFPAPTRRIRAPRVR